MTKEEVQKAFRGLNHGANVKVQSTQFGGTIDGEVAVICCHEKDSDYFSVKISGNGNTSRKIFISDVVFLKRTN